MCVYQSNNHNNANSKYAFCISKLDDVDNDDDESYLGDEII